jgi:pilus assembly protein CpaD
MERHMTSTRRIRIGGPAGRRLRPAALLALGLGLAGTAGCSVDHHEIVGSIPMDYHTNHPIVVDDRVETMDVPVGMTTTHLSEAVRANVSGFASRYKASGSGVIAVVVPSGSANEVVAVRLSGEIKRVLVAAGIPASQIDYRVYGASPNETAAAIRVAFSRVSAHLTHECGRWPDQASSTTENRNYYNFGCATQQNFAAMLDNPLDLLYPRDMDPPDAERRSVVLDNYRDGKPYQSDYSRETGGAIAEGVGE